MNMARELRRGAFDEINFVFAPNLVLWTALELDVFSALAHGSAQARALAERLGCSEKGLRRILDCLAAMGFVKKAGHGYGLSALGRRYGLPSSDDYIGQLFASSAQLIKYWLTLPEAVKTGRPTLGLFPEKERRDYEFKVIEALFQFYKTSAWELARALLRTFAPGRVLDVGAGSAVWSLPFAIERPQAEVTAVDFAPILAITRKFARRFGVEARYRFVAGDAGALDLGEAIFDLALLGHICHSEGAERTQRLIGQCFRALKSGGRLLIMDYIADEKRERELLALLLSVNTLLGTEDGDTFAMSDYTRWLKAAGFARVEAVRVKAHGPVIAAVKA